MASTAIALAPRPWKTAALWLLFLGPFFFASYGFANWLTSQRAHVPAIVFDWESRIPFLAWTILPYWSIDLLYGLSLFLLARAGQVHTHARRLLAAQIICVTCFLLFPLSFSFAKPDTAGFFGWLFDTLAGFDKPFNQAPSLHIVLLIILWVCFARVVPRAWHWLLHAWFALIGVSVLTTYQHHFVDLPTGVWVGCFCVWLHPDDGARWELTRDPVRRRLSLRYAVAAGVIAALAVWLGTLWRGAWWLWWPAGALALVASVYLLRGPSGFHKRADGSFAWTDRVLFAPYVLGAWINSRLWTRGKAQHNEIVPGVMLGRMPRRGDLQRDAIRAVVDVTAELPFTANGLTYYHNVAMLDLAPISSEQLAAAAHAIETARQHGRTLVCCALGYSRSALSVAAWLVAYGHTADVTAALALVRKARPFVVLHDRHHSALQQFALSRAEHAR